VNPVGRHCDYPAWTAARAVNETEISEAVTTDDPNEDPNTWLFSRFPAAPICLATAIVLG
jgi:hypothetical protein